MSVLKIIRHPDKRLRIKALPVMVFNRTLRETVKDMFETMYANQGIGLAATQVGCPLTLCVINVSGGKYKNEELCLINPDIVNSVGTGSRSEGCLSVPGRFADVKRAKRIKVVYENLDGSQSTIKASGLLARVIQHEMDHMDGKLFIDY